ncbi:hypothetical protein PCE1_001809 [Barthelona sp. PCE]
MKSIAFIGHVTKDKIGETYVPGGGVYYGSAAACAVLSPETVCTYTKCDAESRSMYTTLLNSEFFETSTTTTFENVYPYPENPDIRVSCILDTAAAWTMEDVNTIAEEKPSLSAIVLSPLFNGELPVDVLGHIRATFPQSVIGLDIQGYTRQRQPDNTINPELPTDLSFLESIDVLKVDNAEVALLTGMSLETDLIERITLFHKRYPHLVILCTCKDGVYTSIDEGETVAFEEWPQMPKDPHSRTGRGDTCMATFIASYVDTERDVTTSHKQCAILTSQKMQYKGPYRYE